MKSLNVLVTGATAGIGRHTALTLARAGHRVFATGRRQEALESLQTVVNQAAGLNLDTLVLDVTSTESIAAAKQAVDERTGHYGLDALVNNAGFGRLGPLEEIDDVALRQQFETNVFGLMAVTRMFVPAMRNRGFGRVVNVSGLAGRMTFPLMGAYSASKYAVEALSDTLRNELYPFGVRVSLIEPGYTRTEFMEASMSKLETSLNSPYASAMARANEVIALFNRTGLEPEHVARVILRAVEARSPRARYVTPWHTYAALAFFNGLPTEWVDAALRQAMGLARLTPAAR